MDQVAIKETVSELVGYVSLTRRSNPFNASTKRSAIRGLIARRIERLEDKPPVFGRIHSDGRMRCKIIDLDRKALAFKTLQTHPAIASRVNA